MSFEILLRNCRLIDDSDTKSLYDIAIADGCIVDIGRDVAGGAEHELDAGGRLTIPGLIDIHIQGAGGADVLDGTPEALKTMSSTLARLGTTSFLATTVMSPSRENKHLVNAAAHTDGELPGASLLGIHLEGPFINPVKRGGIAPDAIYPPSSKAIEHIVDITGNTLAMMTIAPELDGSAGIIQSLVSRGVIASFGHSNATYEETRQGFDYGISHVTHIFNAMPPINHRNPGPIPAIIESPNVTIQLIGDGVHVHEAVVRMLFTSVDAGRIVCITDGVQAMGLPEGRYIYNGREYTSQNGSARYDDGTLIGSALSLKDVMLRYATFTGCSLKTALDSVTVLPASILGIEKRKGTLDKGKDADIVILNDDFSVAATIVEGQIKYRS